MTDPLGQSQVLPYLEGLAARGYRITLISFEKKHRYAQNGPGMHQKIAAMGIQWQPLMYHKQPPVFSTLYDIRLLKKQIRQLKKKQDFDIVHCRGYITAFAGAWMKQRWGTRFLFDMRGFFADERVEGGIWNRSNPVYNAVYRYFKKKEKDFFLTADHTLVLTHAGDAIIRGFPYIPAGFRSTVIPCCVDTRHFDFHSQARLSADTPLLHLCYLGSIGSWYMLAEMLDFFVVVLRKFPDARLFFFTFEPEEWIRREAEKRNIPVTALHVEGIERKDLPQRLAEMDLSLFFIRPVFSKKASSPTKQGELMAMGIPVICNTGVGDTDRIVEQYHSGALVSAFNEEAYRKAADRIPELLQLSKEAIRQGALEYFSLELGVEKYAAIYRSLEAGKGA